MATRDGRPPQVLRAGGGVLVRPVRNGGGDDRSAAAASRAAGPVVLEVAGCVGIALAPRRIRSPEAGEEAVRA